MNEAKIKETGSILRNYAEHFTFRDWNYTRQYDIESIYYKDVETLLKRIKNAWRWLTKPREHYLLQLADLSRISMAFHALKKDKNLPDGVLNNGSIITFWEETGEYLQLVQPTVGSLVGKFLEEDPNNPHAIAIAQEIDRILAAYSARVVNGEVLRDKDNE